MTTTKIGYTSISIDKLIKADWNYKKNDKEQEKRLRANITKNGFIENLVVREIENGFEVINGNHRLDVLSQLGIHNVMCYNVGKIDEIRAKRIAIELNETRFPSDTKSLNNLLEELSASFELPDLEATLPKKIAGIGNLSKVLNDLNNSLSDDNNCDDIPPVDETSPISSLGDVWQLGQHRLMCGDSTSDDDLKTLMNGEMADGVITDPPYNLNFSPSTDSKNTILNDHMSDTDFKNFITSYWKAQLNNVKDTAHYYIFCDWRIYPLLFYTIKPTMKIHNLLVWNKPNLLMGYNYRYKHELCIFASKVKSIMFDDKTCSNVMNYHSPSSAGFFKELENEETKKGSNWLAEKSKLILHPTMKPVTMIEHFLDNSTNRDDIVLDCFSGSGTMLIAYERKQRRCYGMELDPKYVDVICERYYNYTKCEPIRQSDGKKWSEL